jgi:hypothetical protein
LEQARPQPELQALDCLADIRFAGPQVLGRPRKAAGLRHRGKRRDFSDSRICAFDHCCLLGDKEYQFGKFINDWEKVILLPVVIAAARGTSRLQPKCGRARHK